MGKGRALPLSPSKEGASNDYLGRAMMKRITLSLIFAAAVASPLCHAMGGTRTTTEEAPAADDGKRIGQGAKLYNQSCYKCHGPQAVSGGTIPDLRLFEAGEEEFVSTALTGRPGTIMPAWKEFLSADDIKSIYAYVRSRPR